MNQKQTLRQQIASIIIDYYYQIASPQEKRNREIVDRLEKLFLQTEEETVKAVIETGDYKEETHNNLIRNNLREGQRATYQKIKESRK